MKLSMTQAITASVLLAAPAFTSSASLRAANDQRELAITVPSDHMVSMTEKVKYTCTVSSSWSSENHPVDYPSDAHTSPPVLVAHNSNYKMFTPGELASPGVKDVAETGNPEKLMEELTDAGADVMSWIVGVPMFFGPKPMEDVSAEPASGGGRKLAKESVTVSKGGEPIYDARSQTIDQMLIFTPEHSQFTAISMLAPSPDWFSSSHGTSPIASNDDGDEIWLKSFKYETLPYDAGTDSGVTFTSEDLPTDPAEGISVFTVDSTDNGIFVNAAGDAVLPVYGWECMIAEVMYKCEFDENCDSGESSDDSGAASAIVSGVLGALALAGSYLML